MARGLQIGLAGAGFSDGSKRSAVIRAPLNRIVDFRIWGHRFIKVVGKCPAVDSDPSLTIVVGRKNSLRTENSATSTKNSEVEFWALIGARRVGLTNSTNDGHISHPFA